MSSAEDHMTSSVAREDDGFWSDLSEKEQHEVKTIMRVRNVQRGELLIEHGAEANALYVVNFGLFEVIGCEGQVVAEIGAGQLIGEIGFFAGCPRTASVVAARNSEVLEIDRTEFDALTSRHPEVLRAVTRALARRLARFASAKVASRDRRPNRPPRVVTVVAAGAGRLGDAFLVKLRAGIVGLGGACFLTGEDAARQFREANPDPHAMASWLAEMERTHGLVVCIADQGVTGWTEIALHSADQVLLVAEGEAADPNPAERLAFQLFPCDRRRMISIEPRRSGVGMPSAVWRRKREVFMTHHLAMEDDEDFRSIARFLAGRAIGFVASGGGAYGPAHIGIYRAFREAGVAFDIHGGASVGAAMAATFSLLMEPEAIKAETQQMFVERAALKRFTIPRYGLLDHEVFDRELRQRYGIHPIEDMWKPYFAVATDLSTYSMRVMREGPLWEAIRASCAIPAVLPPFFDAAGHMLVDGAVMDNVPIAAMMSLKSGPNLVVDLRPPNHLLFSFGYDAIPGRRALIGRLLMPWRGKERLPHCPGPASVIQRSIFGNIRDQFEPRDPHELTLRPPAFRGSSFMNWDRHTEVLDASYEWAKRAIDSLLAAGDPALTAMLAYSKADGSPSPVQVRGTSSVRSTV